MLYYNFSLNTLRMKAKIKYIRKKNVHDLFMDF